MLDCIVTSFLKHPNPILLSRSYRSLLHLPSPPKSPAQLALHDFEKNFVALRLVAFATKAAIWYRLPPGNSICAGLRFHGEMKSRCSKGTAAAVLPMHSSCRSS